MDRPKKILILHASAGHGHEKAARAVWEACKRESPDGEILIADTLDFTPSWFKKIYRESYFFQIKNTPWLWGLFYFTTDWPVVYFFVKWIRRALNASVAGRLHRHIESLNPDWIFCTHFMGAEVAGHLKSKTRFAGRLGVQVTDFLPHLIWMHPQVDRYFVACEETSKELIKRGVAPDRIHVCGIPIEEKFSIPLNGAAIRSGLNLREDHFTVLVTSGGGGIGDTGAVTKAILSAAPDVQVLAICGTNKSVQAELGQASKFFSQLRVFGFVDNMHELMEVSDLVVGKAGGLTLTESLSKAKPMILFKSIPGQETRNAKCVYRYKAGFHADSIESAAALVSELARAPERVREASAKTRLMTNPDAAHRVAQVICHG